MALSDKQRKSFNHNILYSLLTTGEIVTPNVMRARAAAIGVKLVASAENAHHAGPKGQCGCAYSAPMLEHVGPGQYKVLRGGSVEPPQNTVGATHKSATSTTLPSSKPPSGLPLVYGKWTG
jgi:hypothetical protein